MKRMDRLMAILMALQQRAETARSLADKFEVSKRTILRDMQSLSEMGVPLVSMTGPTGGFQLMEGYQLSPLQFTSQEALTILVSLQAMTKMTDTPFNKERWTVIDKIKNSLPENILKQIEPILERTEVEVPKRNYKAPQLSALIDYTSESRWLKVFYRSQRHQRWLCILPKRIYTSHGFWYCEAYSPTHEEERLFRVDRMDKIEVIERPEYESENHLSHKDQSNSNNVSSSFRVKAKLTYRGMLQVEQDIHIGECVHALSNEEWEADFQCPATEWSWAVRFFFSLGSDAEVTEPETLRKEIYRMAERLCNQYKS